MTETSDVIKGTALCLCCTQLKFTFYQLTGRINVLVSSSTDETKGDLNHSAQQCYQMNCIVFALHTVEIYILSADRQDLSSC